MKLLIVIFLFYPLLACSQDKGFTDLEFMSIVQVSVHNPQNFTKKFNGDVNMKNETVSSTSDKDSIRRFNLSSIIATKLKQSNKDLCIEFAKDCISKKYMLNKADKDWYAEVVLDVTYKDKAEKITLILDYECDKACTWYIKKIQATFIEKSFQQLPKEVFFSSVDDELDFPTIVKMFGIDKKNAYQYAKVNKPQIMDILLFSIQEGFIKFSQISKVSYHFLQVENWIFVLEEHLPTEKNLNSGFLISKLLKASQEDKKNYLKQQLKIHD